MPFRKNKQRKHTCSLCGFSDLNLYFGTKSYNDIPLYDFNFYKLEKSKCAWCQTEYYYLVDLER